MRLIFESRDEHEKVLIVDDEFLIRFTLEEGLKDRGYETQSAETVKDALEKMKRSTRR